MYLEVRNDFFKRSKEEADKETESLPCQSIGGDSPSVCAGYETTKNLDTSFQSVCAPQGIFHIECDRFYCFEQKLENASILHRFNGHPQKIVS